MGGAFFEGDSDMFSSAFGSQTNSSNTSPLRGFNFMNFAGGGGMPNQFG